MAQQGREAEAEAEEGSRQEGGDKEAEPRTFGGVPNLSFSGQGGTRREKVKVRTLVKFWFFHIVDHLLMRSLWLE